MWNAWAKGYKLGVQASSDHLSTHISYACTLAEDFTREGLLDAMRRRHSYGATDNIILDFQAEANGESYIMGDIIQSKTARVSKLHVIGTSKIKQLVLVKNQQLIYVRQPDAEEIQLEFVDRPLRSRRTGLLLRARGADRRTGGLEAADLGRVKAAEARWRRSI